MTTLLHWLFIALFTLATLAFGVFFLLILLAAIGSQLGIEIAPTRAVFITELLLCAVASALAAAWLGKRALPWFKTRPLYLQLIIIFILILLLSSITPYGYRT